MRRLLPPLLVLLLAACAGSGDHITDGPAATASTAPESAARQPGTSEPGAGQPGADQPGAGASAGPEQAGDDSADQRFPEVIDAQLTRAADGTWTLAATISSPYDTPEQYADAFRALGPDGAELGVRALAHDHAGEQPFTRSLTGLEIAGGISRIEVQGRDLLNGWGGTTVWVDVPR